MNFENFIQNFKFKFEHTLIIEDSIFKTKEITNYFTSIKIFEIIF